MAEASNTVADKRKTGRSGAEAPSGHSPKGEASISVESSAQPSVPNAAFTPGPWAAYRDEWNGFYIDTAVGVESTNGYVIADNIMGEQLEANAYLIAAAPELYEVVAEWLTVGNDLKARKAVREKARAALAKVNAEQVSA